MTELSDSARKVLEDRDDNGFLFSNSGGLKGGPAIQVRRSLLNAGMVERLPHTGQGDEFEDGDGVHALKVTEAGYSAVGGQKPATQAEDAAPAPEGAQTAAAARAPRTRENSKQAQLIAKLRDPNGATVDELASAFGWLKHTTRSAISTLPKKANVTPTSERVEGRGRVYRLPAA
jgi:hypothetical protein